MSDRWSRNLKRASAVLLALAMGTAALPNALPAYASGEAIVSTEAVGNQETAPGTGDGTQGKADGSLETAPEAGDGSQGPAEDRTEAPQETGDDSPEAADGEMSGGVDESAAGEDDQNGLVIEDGADGVSDIVSEETPDDGLFTGETEETEASSEGQPVTMTETAQIQDPLSAPGRIAQTQTGTAPRRVRRALLSGQNGGSYAFSSQLGANAKAIYDSKVEWYATEHHTGEWSCKFGEGVYQFRGVVTSEGNSGGNTLKKYYDKTDAETKSAYEDCKEQMMADMQAAADAFKHDHPEVFWIRSPKTYSFSVSLVPGTEQTGVDGKTRGVFELVSATYNPVETFAGAGSLISSYQAGVQAAAAKVREMADSWNTEGAENGSAAYQALLVRAVDEYLCGRLFYDHAALNTAVSVSAAENSGGRSVACNDAYRIYTSAAAFLDGTDHLTMGAVCEGYAKAFKVLCDQLGVPAVCVSGLSDRNRTGSGHMWNLAQIGGVWYLVDVTWDDSDKAGAQASSRRYLLVSNYTNNTLLTSRQASGNFSGSTITTTFSYPAASDTCYETAHQGTTIDFKETSRKPATCTQKGSVTETCSRCGETKTTALPALGHDFQEKTVAATCTAKGRRSVVCSRCGEVKSEQEFPALGHSFKETSRKPATCTQKGSVTETCSRCGETKSTELPALGHVYTVRIVEPTTSRGGYTLHTCIRCGDTWQDQYTAKLLKKTNLRKVSAASKGKFRVTFRKNGKYTRYQIQYAGKKNFTGAKNRTVTNKKKTASVTIRAGRGKTYYVRIRAVSGKRVGAWSRVLKVRTK
ncbi:transglutaminase domain-containing protein [Porcincola sp. LCP21S3_C12]|uniref:transglutaminase domain-containing protein n=1 Tax=Porcincola sp. LCP21S3_C12 TaxID=3438798 RepID=UPI003F9B94C4